MIKNNISRLQNNEQGNFHLEAYVAGVEIGQGNQLQKKSFSAHPPHEYHSRFDVSPRDLRYSLLLLLLALPVMEGISVTSYNGRQK